MLPKPLYETLPYGYVLAGVLAIVGIEPIFGKACGILLIVIGLFVYQARMRYRHRKQRIVAYGGTRHPGLKRTDNHGEPLSRTRTPAQQDFYRGEENYAEGNYAEARQWYRQAAEEGNISAQVNLGVMCVAGQGGPLDYQEALYWYGRAADQGDAVAQFNLGAMYVEGQGVARNFEEAMRWYRKAADQSHAPAQFSLGILYEQTPGTIHLQEALQWYRKAADQGYAPAQVNLGVLYAEGRGARQNFQEALRWYQAAATSGYAPAQFNLGVMYLEGQQGIPADRAIAYVWFARAAGQGDADAQPIQQELAAQLTAEQKAQVAEML
ncbi:MAG: sel1 repeat family protein [Candidatus Contendobacter sp.]|nr:sel1 repeat family protein [Candidatus Contendobacter sp.]